MAGFTPALRNLPRSRVIVPLLRMVVAQHQERLTPRGRYLFWTMAAFALVGLDTRRTQVFVLFAVLAGLFVVALAFALAVRPRARLECRLPARATAGRPLPITARVSDAGGLLRDLFVSFPRPRRWGSSLKMTPRQLVIAAQDGVPLDVGVELRALRRGRYELRGPTVRATDPLGLVATRAVAASDQVLLVYPRFYTLPEFPVPAGRRYQPGGIPLSSSTGDAVEFVGTRDYREGDPIRHIHWRSWARRGQPVVKEYQEEYFCRIALVLDTFLPKRPSAGDLAGFEASISLLASIADHFSRSEYIVDVLAAGPDLFQVSAGRSLAYLENILDVLACLEPCYAPPFETVAPALFEELAQITTVVAVLQDWDPPRQAFLRKVKELGTEVRVLVVREGATAEAWQAVGPELGEVSVLTPADLEKSLLAAEA
jgi:uncharacterized protein (DUF58 family)